MSRMDFSFLMITKNEGAWLPRTVQRVLETMGDHSELLILDDDSTDGSTGFLEDSSLQKSDRTRIRLLRAKNLGVARARNAIALAAKGSILFFLDAHMTLSPGWWEPVTDLLSDPHVGAAQPCISSVTEPENKGYGERFKGPDLTLEWLLSSVPNPHSIPILCGCCFAVRRDLFLRIGGLDGGMIGWGSEDCEFSLRLWRLGYEAWIEPRVSVGHLFRKAAPYSIQWKVVLHNRLRIAMAHFSDQRISNVIDSLRCLPEFEVAHREVMNSDIWHTRKWLDRHAVRDDNWFLNYSGLIF